MIPAEAITAESWPSLAREATRDMMALPGVISLHTPGSISNELATMLIGCSGVLPGTKIELRRGALLSAGRNDAVLSFLTNPATPPWLLFIDSDATFAPWMIHRVVRRLFEGHPIVGGLAVLRREQCVPTIGRNDVGGVPAVVTRWRKNQLVRARWTGCHFLAIRRDALTRLSPPWFAVLWAPAMKDRRSEDSHLCNLAHEAGLPIAIDTSLVIGHTDEVMLGGPASPQGPGVVRLEVLQENGALALNGQPWPIGESFIDASEEPDPPVMDSVGAK